MVDQDKLPEAIIEEESGFSLVWIIPIVAALIAGWLVFKVYSEKGDIVTLTFDNAEGVEIKKTVVRYKDVNVGKVVDIRLDKTLEKVEVKTEIYQSMAKHLGPDTKFWVVRPVVSVSGVSGLTTLISGIYIGMDPGEEKGKARKVYEGLKVLPRVTSADKGGTYTLEADTLGSLGAGSPVYYREINVGEVASYELSEDKDTVKINIFIKDPFHKIIKQNTQFWNISGLEIEVSPSGGVEVRMGTLTSLLLGGIAFETPQNLLDQKEADSETEFLLYKTREQAREKTRGEQIYYVLYFEDSLRGLVVDAPVEYRGIKVGKVEDIRLHIEEYSEQIRIPVLISLYAEKLSIDGDPDDAQDVVRELVENGLRAQLTTSNFLTGTQYVSLVVPEDKDIKPGKILESSESGLAYEELPTMSGLSKLLAESATEIMEEIQGTIKSANRILSSPEIASSQKDLARILDQVNSLLVEIKPEIASTIKNVESMTSQLDSDTASVVKQLKSTMNKMDYALVEAQKTLKNANNTLDEDSSLQYELRLLIEEVSEAANSFSVLADTIQRKPNSVIFGK